MIDGGGGVDRLVVEGSALAIDVTLADPVAWQTLGDGQTLRGIEALTLVASGLDDRIVGGRGDDELWGEEGDDRFEGGADSDTLDGGMGDDSIYGGDGNDTSPPAPEFQLDAEAFVLGGVAQDAGDRILYDGATGEVRYDPDGNGSHRTAVILTLTPGAVLTAGQFFLT